MGSSGCRAEPRPAADGLQRLLLPRIIVALFFPRVRLSPVSSTRAVVISQRAVQWLWNGSAKTQIVSEEFVNYKTLIFSIVYIPFDTSQVIARQFLGS